MAQLIGTIKEMSGIVIARNAIGEERILKVGDAINFQDTISTIGAGSHATLSLVDGRDITLSGNDGLLLDKSVYAQGEAFGDEAIIASKTAEAIGVGKSVAEIQEALLRGEDISNLEATAAGNAREGGSSLTSGFALAQYVVGGNEANVLAEGRVLGESGAENILFTPPSFAVDPNDTPLVSDMLSSQREALDGLNTFSGNLATIPDGNGDVLTYSMVGNSLNVSSAVPLLVPMVTLNGNGTYNVSGDFNALAVGQSATVTFQYVANDGKGFDGSDGINASSISAPATVTLTITGTNDQPVVENVSVSQAELTAGINTFEGNLIAQDDDVSDTHTYHMVANTVSVDNALITTLPTVIVGSDGAYSIKGDFNVLAVGESATVTFQYYAVDNSINQINGESNTSEIKTVTLTITGTNDAPIIMGSSDIVGTVKEAGNLDDGTVVAAVSATGTLVVSDVDNGATHTWVGNTIGTYGTFVIDPATGVWTYNVDSTSGSAADKLKEGESRTEIFPATVTDEHGATDTQVVTITILGTNDAPVAVADVNSVTEAGSGNFLHDIDVGNPLALGNLLSNDSDVDGNANPIIALDVTKIISNGTNSSDTSTNWLGNLDVQGSYGTLVVNKATGVYSYILDNGNSLVNALNEGESIVDTFTYTVKDANGALATSTLNITVQGSNDAPVISGALSGTATEAGNLDDGTVVAAVQASGVLIATDADNNAATWSIQGNATGVYGALAIDANGTWTYSVDSQAGSLADQLAEGDVRYETFTIVANDDNAINPKTDTQTITIKIVGTNDAPVATVTDNFGVMEESTVHGQLVANDVDRDDASTTLTYTLVDGKPVPAGFTLNANGSYTFDATHNAYQSLSAGETQDVTFTWIATDSHGATTTEQSVTITITGTNDVPIAVADTNHVSESDSGIYVKTGLWGNVINTGAASGTTGVDSDVDHNTTLSIIKLVDENTGETLTHTNYNWDGSGFHIVGEYGNIMLWPDGKYLYNLYNDRAATNALSEGEIVTETFSYTVSDGQGGEASTTLTITITGTNDAPVLSIGTGDSVLANLIETDAGLLANGTLSLGDVDSTDVVTTAINTISTEGTYTGALPSNLLGMLTLTGGLDSTHTHTTLDWSFNSGSEAFNFLAKGETLVLNYTLLATDNSGTSSSHSNEQIVSITITGTNDAPTIMAHATDSSVLESALLNGSNPFLADTKAEGTFTIGDPDGLDDIKSISIAGSTYSIGAGVGLSDMVGFTTNTAYGEMRITGYSNGVFTYSYTLIAPVDNTSLGATDTLGKDSFVISVFDGTVTASTAVTIDITDDAPKVTQVSVTTPEGANELSGTFVMIGADGGGVTSVTYKGNAITVGQATEIDSGTITINSNGTYTFTPKTSLIHGSTNNFVESVLYTVTDGDGDSVNGKLSINVTDTIATVKAVAQSLDEDDLSNGTDPTKEPTTLTDISLGITEGKDAISDIKFVLGDIQAKFGTLKSQGIALSYEVSLDGHTLSAKAGTNTVFTMSLDGVSRTYDFTLVGQLDHANGGSQNSYALNIPFTIIEIDDAIKASISLKIVDDVPVTTNDVSATIKEDSGDTLSGNVLSNDTWGADGPLGGIESVTFATYGATVLSLNTINHLAIGDITINSDGTWSFTPTADYGGKPVFTYTIQDADGDSISAKLTLNITPLSDVVVVGGDQVFKGYEDNVNNITQVLKDNITFKDFDGSETHTIILGNLQGATVYVNGVAQTGTTVSIVIPSSNAEANYPTIGIKAAANSDADLNGITVKATSKDTGSAITEQASFKLNLGITAIADAPTLTLGNNTTLTSQITDSFGGGNTVSKSATASLSGTEDSEIPLKITLNSADTSETVTSLSIADIPVGASITNGHGTVLFTATMGNTVYTIINPNSSDVASYAIKPASNDATDFALKVTATSAENPTELGDVVTPNSATTTVNVTVNVIADADDTIVTVSNTHLKEDGGSYVDHGMAQSLTLNVTHEGSESATYALSGFLKGSKVTIDGHDILITSNTQVVNASSDVALQGLTFTPPTDYSGTMQIHVVATVKEESTTLNKAFDFNYIIEPTADTPVLLVSDIKGHEGSEIVLADMVLATISMDNVSQTLDGTPEILTLTLTLKNTGSSFDSGATFSSGVITSDANGLHVTLTGTQAQLQTALQGLKFIPGAHASSVTNAYDFTITLASTDSKVIDGTAYTSTSPLVSKDATLTLIGVAEKASSIEAKGVGSEDAATYITLKASSNDADGSESLYGVLKGVPTGEGYGLHVVDASAQVVGTQLVLANVGNGTADWRIDAQTLSKLTSGEYKLLFTTPTNESGLYAMNFVAINAERDGSVSQVVTPFTTIVAPAIEAYSGYSVNGSEFKETNWINLQLSNTGSDHDLFSNTTLSNIPDGAIIAVKNSDGTYTTLIPASGSIALTQEQIDRGVYARFDENASSVTLGATTVHVSQTVTDNGDMSGLTPVSETIERDITLNVKGVADGLLGVSAHDGSVDSNNAVALSSSATKGSLIDTDGSEEAYYLIQNKNDDNTAWVMEGGISLGGGRWLVKATDFDSATIRLTSLSGDGSLDLQVQAVTKEKDGDTNFGGTHDFTITYTPDGSTSGGGSGHLTSPITITTVGTTNEDTSFGLTATGQVLGKAYAFVFDPEIRDAGGNVIATVSSSNYYQLEDGRYVTTDINSLTITPASQYAGNVPLSIAVTQTDSNGAWSDVTPTAPLIVDVHAVLDTVHVSTITVSETDGGWIGFNPHFSSDDTNGTFASEGFLGGSTVTFSFANPSIIEGLRANGVSVTANSDGSYTLNASDVSHLEILPKAYTEGSTTVTASYIWADGTLTHAESKDFTLTFASHVDSIDVSANQSTYTGEEGGKVALGISFSDPTASVYIHQADSDGSEVASVVISGLPSDARLVNSSGNSIGSIKEVSTDVNGETTASWILTKAEAQDAYIQTEEHYSGAFNMGFQAYSYDKISGEISTSGDAITVSVDVHGVASSLSMSTTDVITNEDASVPVILNISMTDTDGSEWISVAIDNVYGGVFSMGHSDGMGGWVIDTAGLQPSDLTSLLYTPKENNSGILEMNVSVTTHDYGTLTTQTATDTLSIAVEAIADMPYITSQTMMHANTGTALTLPLVAWLSDTDGSETLSVIINTYGKGDLSAGVNNGDGTWTLSASQLPDLQITPSVTENFTISITAVATENANADQSIATHTIMINAGNETLYASDAGETLYGDSGNDILYGGAGDDVLHGGEGNDYLDGGAGSDRLYGGVGNDTLVYGTADNVIDGGAGLDTLLINADATVDLSQIATIANSIEVLDLTKASVEVTNINVDDILKMTADDVTHILKITGESNDSVSGTGWSPSTDTTNLDAGYTRYEGTSSDGITKAYIDLQDTVIHTDFH